MIKEITGFSRYYISDDGKVFSTKKGEMKELSLAIKRGYLTVKLRRDDGVVKEIFVHRLVAMMFIPNPESLPFVNHKNEIKDDNRVENLEWCNHRYNINYGTRNERVSEANKVKLKGNTNHLGKHTTPCVKCTELDIIFPYYKACNDYMVKYLSIKHFNVAQVIKYHDGYCEKYNLTFIVLPSQD